MENKPMLGELLKGDEERDAIHIAILPVTASTYIPPGAQIFVDVHLRAVPSGQPNAVADPFLKEGINRDQKFYALLFPYTIQSLRHEWVHPEFPKTVREQVLNECGDNPENRKSAEWIMNFADDHYVSFGELMSAADDLMKGHSDSMDITFGMDVDYDERIEFWEHYGALRGQFVPSSVKEECFSCAC